MITFKIVFAIFALLSCFKLVKAKSLDYIMSLINRGRYVDVAKQLRPLADGGNVETQVHTANYSLKMAYRWDIQAFV